MMKLVSSAEIQMEVCVCAKIAHKIAPYLRKLRWWRRDASRYRCNAGLSNVILLIN